MRWFSVAPALKFRDFQLCGHRAGMHSDYLVGQGDDLVGLVRYEQGGNAQLLLESAQMSKDLHAGFAVQAGQRFIEEQDAWL